MQKKGVASGLALVGGAAGLYEGLRRFRRDRAGVVSRAITVFASPEEVRRLWAQPDMFPGVLEQVPLDHGQHQPVQAADVRGLWLRTALAPAPGGRGAEVRVSAEGPAARKMSGKLREDLRRFKAIVECGEAVTVRGQVSGRGPANSRVQEEVNRLLRRGGLG